jgi:hypothetical protein
VGSMHSKNRSNPKYPPNRYINFFMGNEKNHNRVSISIGELKV